jgi:hypothetical protein
MLSACIASLGLPLSVCAPSLSNTDPFGRSRDTTFCVIVDYDFTIIIIIIAIVVLSAVLRFSRRYDENAATAVTVR